MSINRDKVGQPPNNMRVVTSIGNNQLLYDGHPTQATHQFFAVINGKTINYGKVSLPEAETRFTKELK